MEELKNKILLKKYKIIQKIGKGSFGSVFLGKNIQQNDYVAIKLESKNQNDTILEREAYILYSLKGFGIPEIITYGQNVKYNILIQELLGKSIDNIFFAKKRKFPMKDCCMIGLQILDRLEYIHSKYIIHRDIKADNFLIGLKNKSIIYIIDFGLAKQYKSRKTGKHVKYTINKKWSGTSRFASANTLRGVEPSRRDDLESFCYLLLYLMKGSLPWDYLNEESEINEILIIYKMKQYLTPEQLFKDLPLQMVTFYKYCKNLEFEQKPNYKYLRSLLINILKYIGEQNDLHFCWIINFTLNKSKSGFIFNKPKEKEIVNKKGITKEISNSREKNKNIKNMNEQKKKYINLDYSTGKINKKQNLNNEIKNNILGHCNIIKRKYIKSQSPEMKGVSFDEDKNKKKIIPKKNIVIDLTNYIETKKANIIKSYRTKLFNYKANERQIKFINQSDNYSNYIGEKSIKNVMTERNLIKSPKNLFLKKILRNTNNNINNITSYTFNNISNSSFVNNIKNSNNNNIIKNKTKISSYNFKDKIISPMNNKINKKINLNINGIYKLNMNEESKNGYSKKKKYCSNSFGKNIKYHIKNIKLLKELEIIDNNKNINNNNLKKELSMLIPRRQKTTYTLDSNRLQQLKSLNSEKSKNKYKLIFMNNKKYMVLSPDNIKRKKTETGIANLSFKKKFIFENNNIKKIELNKKTIKKEKIIENKKINYDIKNNYVKDQIFSSYNKNNYPKKKLSYNLKNLNLVQNSLINNF